MPPRGIEPLFWDPQSHVLSVERREHTMNSTIIQIEEKTAKSIALNSFSFRIDEIRGVRENLDEAYVVYGEDKFLMHDKGDHDSKAKSLSIQRFFEI